MPPRYAMGVPSNLHLKVSDLWIPGQRTWNVTKLNEIFTLEDAALAQQVIISQVADQDKYVWPFTKNCQYSVKTGYWVGIHMLEDNHDIDPPPGSIELKQDIWKLQIPPKLQHYFWRIITGALPVSERLISRTINVDPLCKRCCTELETINHVLFECIHAKAVWRCSHFQQFDNPATELEDNLKIILDIMKTSTLPPQVCFFPCWILWFLWKSRNELIFENRCDHPSEDSKRAEYALAEWLTVFQSMEINRIVRSQIQEQRSSEWQPPPINWLKRNFDSSFRVEASYTGVGWIVRDSSGTHIS